MLMTCKQEFVNICQAVFGEGEIEFEWSNHVLYFRAKNSDNLLVPYGYWNTNGHFVNGNKFELNEDAVMFFKDSYYNNCKIVSNLKEEYSFFKVLARDLEPATFEEFWGYITDEKTHLNFYLIRKNSNGIYKAKRINDSIKTLAKKAFEIYKRETV